MAQISQRELLYLKDALDAESLMVEKFGVCSQNATDPEVQRVCRDIQETHRAHHQALSQFLAGAGGKS